MKKILLVLVVLMLCSFTPQVSKEYTYFSDGVTSWHNILGKVVMVDDMRILILYKRGDKNSPTVINLTKDKIQIEKDKLEIELLKKQLGKK